MLTNKYHVKKRLFYKSRVLHLYSVEASRSVSSSNNFFPPFFFFFKRLLRNWKNHFETSAQTKQSGGLGKLFSCSPLAPAAYSEEAFSADY